MEHSSVDSLMVWMVNYLMNSAWQVPLVLLVAMVAARLVARLYSAAAVHWTWVSALVLATVLPALRVEMWPKFPWGRAAAVAGGHVQVAMMAGTAAAGGHLRLSFDDDGGFAGDVWRGHVVFRRTHRVGRVEDAIAARERVVRCNCRSHCRRAGKRCAGDWA